MSGLDRRRRFAMVVAALVVFAVVAAFGYGLVSLFAGTSGSRSAASDAGTPAGGSTAAAVTTLSYSPPTHLTIAAIGVDGALQQVGVDSARNTLQLPAKVAQAAWFSNSKTPGQAGPTVIIGYISSGAKKPGVFAKMAELRPGGEIRVTRTDAKTVVFTVDSITEYPLNQMPTDKVFAATAAPTLRIITCGGSLHDASTASNVVVYAHMTGTG
ncbi:sortase domain-containing protein [Fodinicola feengrottensis]